MKFELSAAELASLDTVIAKMTADPKASIESIEPEMGRAVTTVVVTAIFVLLGAEEASQSIKDVVSAAKKVSLNDLLEIRKKAILKKE